MMGCEGTALYRAVEQSDMAGVKSLVAKKDPSKRDPELLKLAIDKGHPKIIELLLRNGASSRRKCKFGKSPIFYAVISSNLETVQLLLANGASIEDEPDLLSTAAKVNNFEIVQYLIQLGADVNAVSEKERSAVFYAVKNSNLKVINLLIAKNAKIQDETELLKMAIEESSPDTIELLLQNGVNPCAGDCKMVLSKTKIRKEKESSLELAWDENFLGKLSKLSTSCSGDNFFAESKSEKLNYKNTKRWSTLHLAADTGRVEVVSLLLKFGADVDSVSAEGQTPLIIAADRGHLEVVKTLLDFDASIAQTDESRRTAFHAAARHGHAQILQTLLDYCFNDSELLDKTEILQVMLVRRYAFGDNFNKRKTDWKTFINVISKYLIKLKATEISVDSKNLTALQCCDKELLKLRLKLCKAEVLKLKDTVFGKTNVSLYDVIKQDEYQIADMLEIGYVSSSLMVDYEVNFKLFGSIVNSKLRKGEVRKQLSQKSVQLISKCIFVNFALTERIAKNIIKYLSNKDLRILIRACTISGHKTQI